MQVDINLKLTNCDRASIDEVCAFLGRLDMTNNTAIDKSATATESAPKPAPIAPAPKPEPAPEQKPAAVPAPKPEPAPKTESAPASTEGLTASMLQNRATRFIKKFPNTGRDRIVKLLSDLGAARISGIPEGKMQEFVDLIEALDAQLEAEGEDLPF